jgi:hypothetical protein
MSVALKLFPQVYRRSTVSCSQRFLCRELSASTGSSDGSWESLSKKCQELAKLLIDDEDVGSDNRIRSFQRRRGLSQAITLIESQKPSHQIESINLLTYLLHNNHKKKSASFRLGIAGAPGAGTFLA